MNTSKVNLIESKRNLELDIVKGLLVLTMVVYHTFYNLYDNYESILVITKYVSGGFIYITGFLVGHYYFDRYVKDRSKTTRRLWIRFGKLFVIFLICNLNLFIQVYDSFSSDGLRLLIAYLVIGTGKSHFEILLPISYFLLLSPSLLSMYKKHHVLFNIAGLILVGIFSTNTIPHSTNLYFLIIGYAGLCSSLLINKISDLARFGTASALVAFFIGWIRLKYPWGHNYALYILYIIVVLTVFYNLSATISYWSMLERMVQSIGRYTLFSYIYQLLIIVAFTKLMVAKFNIFGNIGVILCVSLILIGTVNLIEWLRKKVHWFDWSYRLIFA